MATTTTVEVVVPDGLSPGDEFNVEFDGTSFSIVVPAGAAGGQPLALELPASTPQPTGTTSVEIVVPDGLTPGDEFTVEWGGTSYSIAVPDGVASGQALTIELPELPGGAEEPAAAPEPASVAAAAAEEEEDTMYQAAGEHYLGKVVQVLRSNGEYAPATIIEFNFATETYTVDLGGGMLKYCVESGSIAPADHVAAMVGDFKVGLRVMVPHLGMFISGRDPEREDVVGEISGYTPESQYEVRLDTGVSKNYIWAHQIRPLRRQKK